LSDSDKSHSLERLYSFVLATQCNQLDEAKQIYFSICENHPNESSIWFYFIQFSMLYDFQNIREIYNQALFLISSYYPFKSIGMSWIEFERQYGDLKSILYVENIYQTKLKQLEETKKSEDLESKAKQIKEIQETKEKPKTGEKRKRETEPDSHSEKNKKIKLEGPGDESLTLFVLNVAYTMTEDLLKGAFEGVGCKVKQVRIIKGQKGVPKGYAYIEMMDNESIEKGLSMDKKEIQGRMLKVEISQKPQPGEKIASTKKPKKEINPGERKKKKTLFGASSISNSGSGDVMDETSEPLSNSDFKKFF
jgi:hypothetical protein